jgi:hypothetical protein
LLDGAIWATNVVAPGTGPTGQTRIFTDATDKRLHDKNDLGVIGTTVVADTGATHQYLTAVSAAGVISKARPNCANLSDSTVYCNDAVGQLSATATNDSAASGKVGEYVSSTVVSGSAVSLTTATAANVTSISLGAGDWDVCMAISFIPTSTTLMSLYEGSMSTTTATRDTAPGKFVQEGKSAAVNPAPNPTMHMCDRFLLSGTTTVFMVAFANFTVSTLSAYGKIQARRRR